MNNNTELTNMVEFNKMFESHIQKLEFILNHKISEILLQPGRERWKRDFEKMWWMIIIKISVGHIIHRI